MPKWQKCSLKMYNTLTNILSLDWGKHVCMDSEQVYLQLDISCNHAGPLAIAVTSEAKGHLGTKKKKKS